MSSKSIIKTRRLWKFFDQASDRRVAQLGSNPTFEQLSSLQFVAGVREVDLSINESEVFVVMGLSGSGKSTLIRCLTGLYPASFGSIVIDDIDLSQCSAQDLMLLRRRNMGMVFQNFALLPHLSALDNVAFPLRVQGVGRDERRNRAIEMLDLVGLRGMEARFPTELSGGQQQRVGIARSLATKPRLWFLDEPFSALDPLIRYDMQSELQRLQKLLKKTIVFITHDFDEAIRIADRIAIMRDGRVVQIGTAEELVLAPADDQVARFVERVPKQKILKAKSLCRPIDGGTDLADLTVDENESISDVLPAVMSQDKAVRVTRNSGETIGSLWRDDVVRTFSK
ncbi:MAG: ATP-binding cassette domain-containing protein [Pseudomonadota bacterium]